MPSDRVMSRNGPPLEAEKRDRGMSGFNERLWVCSERLASPWKEIIRKDDFGFVAAAVLVEDRSRK